jgi:hypothetical protein
VKVQPNAMCQGQLASLYQHFATGRDNVRLGNPADVRAHKGSPRRNRLTSQRT